VYRRTGDKPFSNIESVITVAELKALADGYRQVTAAPV
jgi:hypothetical protein